MDHYLQARSTTVFNLVFDIVLVLALILAFALVPLFREEIEYAVKTKTKKQSPYYWLAEPLLDLPSLVERRMFGCDAFYVNGRLQLVLCPGEEEPWKGVLFPLEREMHSGLINDLPALSPHPVLGKWLYLSESSSDFEGVVQQWVNLVLANDNRIGVLPEAERGGKRRGKKRNGG